jgi:hypothetical protein
MLLSGIVGKLTSTDHGALMLARQAYKGKGA